MTTPIRVLQVFTILNRGGAETMVMNYYRHMDRSRVQFDFLVCRPDRGAYEEEIEAMGGRIYRVPPVFEIFAHRAGVRSFFDEHAEYRIIHGHVGELGYCIYREAKARGVPCIIAHAHSSFCDRDWKLPFRYVLKYAARQYVTHTMACGSEAANWYFGKSLSRETLTVHNAIDAAAYRFSEAERHDIRSEMGWEGRWVVGDVARFSPVKNHRFLIKLLAAVMKKRPNVLLVLVGDPQGEEYNAVKMLVSQNGLSEHVQFLGSRSDVPRLLQGMDVYCSPSLYEGLSVSMVEAQAAGLRVITSTGVPDEVRLLPGSVEFLPLDAPLDGWVDHLLAPYERRDTYEDICKAGYDIGENAQWLQQFYLDQVQTIE